MSDIKLFQYNSQAATELVGSSATVERQLQNLIEARMDGFLGVHFLASEYSTGKQHNGRIDSLGLDENGCPVIIEYKRHTNENVIVQGLFYLDWLLNHKAEFWKLVMNKLGQEKADAIEWSGTRLICIAGDYTRYDKHAVGLISRNIELIRYKLFSSDLVLFELVNSVTVPDATHTSATSTTGTNTPRTHAEQLANAPAELRELFEELSNYVRALGEDIQEKQLKRYVAFSRIKNFICATVTPKNAPHICMWLKLNPDSVELEENFSRDVRNIGHWGTGDLEIIIRTNADFEKAKVLIERCYQES